MEKQIKRCLAAPTALHPKEKQNQVNYNTKNRLFKGEIEMENVQVIINDIDADRIIEVIKEEKADFLRLEELAAQKIEAIHEEIERKRVAHENSVGFKVAQLRAYFNTITPKETKTQKKYSLLAGEMVLKKPISKLDHDDKKLIEYCKSANQEKYIKRIETEKLDWSNFKKDLEINGDVIIHKETGEIIDCDGINVIEVPEQFEIKF